MPQAMSGIRPVACCLLPVACGLLLVCRLPSVAARPSSRWNSGAHRRAAQNAAEVIELAAAKNSGSLSNQLSALLERPSVARVHQPVGRIPRVMEHGTLWVSEPEA